MSFGQTITLTIFGGPKVLNRINQDAYGAEFLLREATQEFRMKIRHYKDGPNRDGIQFDRHNVELNQTVYATATAAMIKRQAYVVFRNAYSDAGDPPADFTMGLVSFLTKPNVLSLTNWAS